MPNLAMPNIMPDPVLSQRSAADDCVARLPAWRIWMHQTRARVAALEAGRPPAAAADMFHYAYAANFPATFKIPGWPALGWTPETLRSRVGGQTVQVQVGRSQDPNYELRSRAHRGEMTVGDFLDRAQGGPDNDVYMTAQNASANQRALAPLYADLAPLPPFLLPASESAFLWIGGRTMTPLHHDLTNNLLCQVHGRKLVRLISPMQHHLVENFAGVHSRLGWVSDAVARARGIAVRDVVLAAGEALFLPVGWWHCVRAEAFSITAVFTSFLWPNDFSPGFPP